MRINKLTIENFRSYEHKTEFTFKGKNDINVILGQNGTGKTSFLSAIKYVLFGPRTFGSDFYTKDYINWANREINFNSTSDTFEVGLQFEYNDQLIDVVRTSTVGDKYEEEVVVFISGQRQKNASFLDNFNYNLYNNIFFNGENISNLTSSAKELRKFTESIIDVYFEFDVFKNVIKDTENAISKNLKAVATGSYKVLESDLKRNTLKIEGYVTSLNNIQSELDSNVVKLEQLKIEMNKRHALSSHDEKKIQKKVDEAKLRVFKVESKIIKFLKTDAHYYLTKNLLIEINNELKDTRKKRLETIKSLYLAIESGEFIDVRKYEFLDLNNEIKISNNSMFNNKDEFVEIIKEYNSSRRSLRINQKKLSDSEAGKKLLNYNVNADFIEERIEDLKKKYNSIENKLNVKEVERAEIINKIEIEKKKMLDDELLNNAIHEKNNLIEICNRYLKEQSATVFNQVAGSMEDILKNYLLRKNHLVDSITISDYTLSIRKDGKLRQIDSFSAGEQQLFLIALIFAVLKEARVEVPLILDTFFARIDDVQQDNLIKFLCSQLKNQILFIATDSELPKDKLAKFTNINKIYKLENEGYITKVGVIDENKNK